MLLGRLDRHEKALKLYVVKLNSPAKAEAYCIRHVASDPTVYLSLLKVLYFFLFLILFFMNCTVACTWHSVSRVPSFDRVVTD